jgi:O-antigen/teichoic acid export membrane protein
VLASTRYGMLIGLPLAAATFALAEPIVLTLFGPRWEGAVPVVRLLAVAFVGTPLGLAFGPAYMATKRLDVSLKLAIPQGILLVILLALFVHDGITAAAACQAGVRVLFGAVGVVVAVRVLGLRPRELWDVSWPALVATAGMLAVVVPLVLVIDSAPLALVLGGLTGAAVYAALAWLLAGRALRALWGLAVRRERAPVAEL